MRTVRWTILGLAVGLLLAVGFPYVAAAPVHADQGSGCACGCPCGEKGDCGQCGECDSQCPEKGDCKHKGKHEGMHGKDGGHMHGKPMAGGGAMKEGMTRHLEAMRATIAKLRALEAKMDAMKSKDDAAAFRAASLEHSKLLTDIQESHLKHMEGMMGGK